MEKEASQQLCYTEIPTLYCALFWVPPPFWEPPHTVLTTESKGPCAAKGKGYLSSSVADRGRNAEGP